MAAPRTIRTVAALMDLWPKPEVTTFAKDIGIKPTHATAMKVRGSISPAYWPAVVAAAEKRGIEGITLETLTKLRQAKFGAPQKQGRAA